MKKRWFVFFPSTLSFLLFLSLFLPSPFLSFPPLPSPLLSFPFLMYGRIGETREEREGKYYNQNRWATKLSIALTDLAVSSQIYSGGGGAVICFYARKRKKWNSSQILQIFKEEFGSCNYKSATFSNKVFLKIFYVAMELTLPRAIKLVRLWRGAPGWLSW